MTIEPLSNAPTSPEPPKPAQDPLANKDTFLRLLVAQLKNQNPLSPADGLQFVTQLAQFSGLEQTMQIRQELQAIREALTAQAAATTPQETA